MGITSCRFLFLILLSLSLVQCKGTGSEEASIGGSDADGVDTFTGKPESLEFYEHCLVKGGDGCPENLVKEEREEGFQAAPVEILFVLDESCSMQAIANSVRDGFASLQNSIYPEKTAMGVTYMSPARYDSEGMPLFDQPWQSNRVKTTFPGYMRLVNEAHQAEYLTARPGDAGYFPLKACQQSWFEPDAINSNGDYCLDAAVQLGDWCTVVEAGIVTLDQLLLRGRLQGKRLFREKAFVNVVFVSDTHEPGDNYYGKSGAAVGTKNFEDMIYAINKNSPGITSVKFSGIVPLPVVGHPSYQYLDVIGDIPQDAAEAKVGSEGTYNYTYLDIIAQSGGVVSHAKTDDWSEVAEALIEASKKTGTIFVNLDRPAKKVFYLLINDEVIPGSRLRLSGDKKTISLNYSSRVDESLNIEVIYH